VIRIIEGYLLDPVKASGNTVVLPKIYELIDIADVFEDYTNIQRFKYCDPCTKAKDRVDYEGIVRDAFKNDRAEKILEKYGMDNDFNDVVENARSFYLNLKSLTNYYLKPGDNRQALFDQIIFQFDAYKL
jgi:hypothetical protein